MWAPMSIVIFEMVANRIQLRGGHISYQIIMFVFYMFATFLGELLQGYPVFPRTFNWHCGVGECWSQLVGPMMLMLSLQLGFYVIFYYGHRLRNKYLTLT
jgi:hypothetical protein